MSAAAPATDAEEQEDAERAAPPRLREAMSDRLPAQSVERRDKKGFPTPVGRWLRESEDFVRDHLAPSMVGRRGLLREVTVARLQREHFAGDRDHGWALWRLLNLELWYQAFVDG